MRKVLLITILIVLAMPAYALSDAQIKAKLIEESITTYLNTYAVCPCPYSNDKYNQPCGENNAWTISKHRNPLCYPADVTKAMVEAYKRR